MSNPSRNVLLIEPRAVYPSLSHSDVGARGQPLLQWSSCLAYIGCQGKEG